MNKVKSPKILGVDAEFRSVHIRMVTSEGKEFSVLVRADGIDFDDFRYRDKPLTSGRPVRKTADDLFAWIADEGERKPFKSRENINRK